VTALVLVVAAALIAAIVGNLAEHTDDQEPWT